MQGLCKAVCWKTGADLGVAQQAGIPPLHLRDGLQLYGGLVWLRLRALAQGNGIHISNHFLGLGWLAGLLPKLSLRFAAHSSQLLPSAPGCARWPRGLALTSSATFLLGLAGLLAASPNCACSRALDCC